MPLPLDGFDLSIFHEDETETEKPRRCHPYRGILKSTAPGGSAAGASLSKSGKIDWPITKVMLAIPRRIATRFQKAVLRWGCPLES